MNFAHGEFMVAGGYIFVLFTISLGINPILVLFIVLIGGAIIGIIVEVLLIRPVYARYTEWRMMETRHEYSFIVTFALSILLVNLATAIFGPYSKKGPSLVMLERVRIGTITIGTDRLVASGIAFLILVTTLLFIIKTMWGKRMQAVAQNRYGASIAGIETATASMLVFAISGSLAALTGSLLFPIYHVYPAVGIGPAIKSFVIVVLGGMGSIPGSIIAALALGVIESYGSF